MFFRVAAAAVAVVSIIVVCYAQNTTHIVQCCLLFYFVVLFCRRRCRRCCFSSVFSHLHLFLCGCEKVRAYVCECVFACKTFLHLFYSIYMHTICIWICRKKSKTTNRKTSESIRKSCKQYFGVCEWLRENSIWCVTKHTHTHLHRKIYTIRERDM